MVGEAGHMATLHIIRGLLARKKMGVDFEETTKNVYSIILQMYWAHSDFNYPCLLVCETKELSLGHTVTLTSVYLFLLCYIFRKGHWP